MRIINGIFALLLLLFAAVQYNDPDGAFWIVVYGIGALWCGLAALRPAIYRISLPFMLFAATVVVALYGLFHFWPDTPDWWKQDVWWETETAREGMGMMILLVALILAGIVALRNRRSAPL